SQGSDFTVAAASVDDAGSSRGTPAADDSTRRSTGTSAPAGVPALDISQFAPMSDAQIQASAQGLAQQGVNLFATFRFGLRSQIPPASDPRTALIDKALVAHGLLTPEELAEIHRIG